MLALNWVNGGGLERKGVVLRCFRFRVHVYYVTSMSGTNTTVVINIIGVIFGMASESV